MVFTSTHLLHGMCLCLLVDKASVVAYIGTHRVMIGTQISSGNGFSGSLLTEYASVTERKPETVLADGTIMFEPIMFDGDVAIAYKHRQKRPDSYALIERTLLKYQEINGDMLVPQGFIIPQNHEWPKEAWDMKLGSAVCSIRRGNYSSKREQLLSLGFCFNVLEAKYCLARKALQHYRKLHGDMRVLAHFEVPMNSLQWPKEIWGLKLGMIVRNIRSGDSHADKRDDLLSIGFTFDTAQANYEIAKIALLCYKKLYGNLLVPWKFEIPQNDPEWPKKTWGMNLGFIVGSMRRGSYAEKRDELVEMGFDFDSQVVRYGFNATRQALLYYRNSFGDMIVPAKFEVPSKYGNWPVSTRGMKLGYAVKDIKYGRIYADRREDLIEMGFDFNVVKRKIDFDTAMKALLKYKELYSDLLIPQQFVVPTDDDNNWPEDTRGVHLGYVVGRIRSGHYADKREELSKIGFTFCVRKKFSYDCYRAAVAAYRALHGEDSRIPSKYKVPKDSSAYPENTWGMALGNYEQRVRHGSLWSHEASDKLSLQQT